MTWRRMVEFADGSRAITAWSDDRAGTAMLFVIDDEQSTLNADEVEALHQFTFEILAGRRTDPRLDPDLVEIVCGFTWMIGTLEVECCLNLNHGPISATVGHVTSRGTPFVSHPAF